MRDLCLLKKVCVQLLVLVCRADEDVLCGSRFEADLHRVAAVLEAPGQHRANLLQAPTLLLCKGTLKRVHQA